ncbi:hypothetical protein BJ970_001431 [Saccharopolyspora phatthalungensis]|uniref:Uncharacterized protein n=1 Tax=Saccharopolyspora phatthalungensis TaxID=664693 RepID=A0A840Q1L8_9PSEU|nr:hypothetical protein [Saccharopolyspora phatthalungensis]
MSSRTHIELSPASIATLRAPSLLLLPPKDSSSCRSPVSVFRTIATPLRPRRRKSSARQRKTPAACPKPANRTGILDNSVALLTLAERTLAQVAVPSATVVSASAHVRKSPGRTSSTESQRSVGSARWDSFVALGDSFTEGLADADPNGNRAVAADRPGPGKDEVRTFGGSPHSAPKARTHPQRPFGKPPRMSNPLRSPRPATSAGRGDRATIPRVPPQSRPYVRIMHGLIRTP